MSKFNKRIGYVIELLKIYLQNINGYCNVVISLILQIKKELTAPFLPHNLFFCLTIIEKYILDIVYIIIITHFPINTTYFI